MPKRVKCAQNLLLMTQRLFAMILEARGEVLSSHKAFAHREQLSSSSIKTIGAISKVELGWLNWKTEKCQTAIKLAEQVEPLSLIGDDALHDDETQIHAHLVIGRQDGTAHGGHLLGANVRPTCGIVITEKLKTSSKRDRPGVWHHTYSFVVLSVRCPVPLHIEEKDRWVSRN